ncbi:hypothetical protein HZA98_00985 [Candidatus Woesearchaeota archaeon]|nr:hypothetical protein [Candidatus Woesearchaeota archaeon]
MNHTDITIKLGASAVHIDEIHQLTVSDLRRYAVEMSGSPLELKETQGNYQFTWRGASRPRNFKATEPAHNLLNEARYLAGMYDQHSGQFIF